MMTETMATVLRVCLKIIQAVGAVLLAVVIVSMCLIMWLGESTRTAERALDRREGANYERKQKKYS